MIEIDIEVEAEAWTADIAEVERVVERAARAALPESGALAILLADDEAVRAMNARFRGKDRPTNVLSFPALDSARPHLGDLILAHGVCAAEARAQGKPLEHHLSHLVVHGILHLLGHDHEAEAEAEVMEEHERTILAGLGIPDPYLCRDDL